jgi:hypothetical protein
LKIENLTTGILALELPFRNQLEEQYLALAKRHAGQVLKHRKLWPLMPVDGWSGHKMATIFFSCFQLVVGTRSPAKRLLISERVGFEPRLSNKINKLGGAKGEGASSLHLLSTSYVHRKIIVVPVASFRMPTPLSAELEHGSMIETIINPGGRPTWYIVSVG